jgi:hypothetical protein
MRHWTSISPARFETAYEISGPVESNAGIEFLTGILIGAEEKAGSLRCRGDAQLTIPNDPVNTPPRPGQSLTKISANFRRSIPSGRPRNETEKGTKFRTGANFDAVGGIAADFGGLENPYAIPLEADAFMVDKELAECQAPAGIIGGDLLRAHGRAVPAHARRQSRGRQADLGIFEAFARLA